MNNRNVLLNNGTNDPGRLPHPCRLYRVALGLSRKELAARAGVHVNTVSNIELRKSVPTRRTARRIADALAVPLFECFPEFSHYYPEWEK